MLKCCFGDPLGVDSTCSHLPSMPWPAALKCFSWAKAGRKLLVVLICTWTICCGSPAHMRFRQCLSILPCGFVQSVLCMHPVMCDRVFCISLCFELLWLYRLVHVTFTSLTARSAPSPRVR